jgi:putative flippase GtrA
MTMFQRYIVNGVFATAVHYAVLVLNIEVLDISSAGIANAITSVFGITASFVGIRIFVFKATEAPLKSKALRFVFLYAAIAVVHGAMLFLWADVGGYSYSIGFVIATVIQFVLSYLGNNILVFRK